MAFDPVLKAALAQPVASMFTAVEIVHPMKTIRLVDDGFITLFGNLFQGNDPDIGSLGSVTVSPDASDNDTAEAAVTLLPVNAAVEVELCMGAKSAQVSIWQGAFNPVTGLAVGEPYLWFSGKVNTVNMPVESTGDGITFKVGSSFDLFHTADEGMLLSDSFHQSIFPGDLAFQYVVDVTLNMPWGAAGTRPALTKAS